VSAIKFGTDGWRAVIAEGFTFENLEIAAQATADYWKSAPADGTKPSVVVGYDRRFLSDQFAQRVAEIMAGNGLDVILADAPIPTQVVSHAVKRLGAVGGVMITASHNPPIFNGFKLKAHYGGSAEPAICKAVEAQLGKSTPKATPLEEALKSRKIVRKDLLPDYLSAIKKLVDFDLISKSGIRFAHDPLFGVAAGIFERLLAGTTCKVTTLNAVHDPMFGGINPEPIAKNYTKSAAYLSKNPHDICLVTDGDADRVGGMDGRGNALSTHQLICLLLQHFIKRRNGMGRVVKALTTTSMVDRMCEVNGLELVETGVGFKYVCSEMIQGNVLLGFEESGGIGFPGHIPERDGILSGLMLLEMLATEKKPLAKLLAGLAKDYGSYFYARIDTHFPLEKRADLMAFCAKNPPPRLLASPVVDVKSYDGVKFVAKSGAWLMLRGSGTEPILRIYAEADTQAGADKLVKEGVAMTRKV